MDVHESRAKATTFLHNSTFCWAHAGQKHNQIFDINFFIVILVILI